MTTPFVCFRTCGTPDLLNVLYPSPESVWFEMRNIGFYNLAALVLYYVRIVVLATGAIVGVAVPGGLTADIASGAPASALKRDDAVKKELNLWASEERFEALLRALQGLEAHGLVPDGYGYTALYQMRGQPVLREKAATKAWMQAAMDLRYGRTKQPHRDSSLPEGKAHADLDRTLQAAIAAERVEQSLEPLAPQHPEYLGLKAALDRLRDAPDDNIIPLPEGATLKRGSTGLRVQMLRARLVQLGYLVPGQSSNDFDDAVVQAIEMFQRDMGLEPDAIVGPATRATLNLSKASKIDILRINLERWRWLPHNLGRRHVRVNIAGFEASAYNDGVRALSHRAIVGRFQRQTPVFSDEIEYIVFNPWWETPAKLARQDELPLFRRDPEAVRRLGFQVLDRKSGIPVDAATIDWHKVRMDPFPYRLRQAPGPQNALGQVKILFPNRHSVYLHDTPSRQLFEHSKRTFSSGCIRVQDVLELVAWLLNGTGNWTLPQIQAVVKTGEEKWVTLEHPVPVYILYMTAEVGPDGRVRYLSDVYDRDATVLRKLKLIRSDVI